MWSEEDEPENAHHVVKYAIISTAKNIIPSLFHSKSQESFLYLKHYKAKTTFCADHIALDQQTCLSINGRVVSLS